MLDYEEQHEELLELSPNYWAKKLPEGLPEVASCGNFHGDLMGFPRQKTGYSCDLMEYRKDSDSEFFGIQRDIVVVLCGIQL